MTGQDAGGEALEAQLERAISAAMLHLRRHSPFFATLCLFARLRPTDSIPTAATDGKDIFYNPTWLSTLLPTPARLRGLLIHEVLHAALLHVQRRGGREPLRWNIAADVVVNGMIDAEKARAIVPWTMTPKQNDPRLQMCYVWSGTENAL